MKSRKKRITLTAEERRRAEETRRIFENWHPTIEELLATGEYDGPFGAGNDYRITQVLVALRQAHEAAGLTQEQLAEGTGINATAISRIERGRQRNVTLRTLQRLAHGVGCQLLFRVVPEEQEAAEPPKRKAAGRPAPRHAPEAGERSKTRRTA